MIVLSLTLLAFGVADLLRWSPEPVRGSRTTVAAIGATAATAGLARLGGLEWRGVILTAVLALVAVTVWLLSDEGVLPHLGPHLALTWVGVVLTLAVATSSLADPVSGPLGRWYADLAFPFKKSISADQFLVGMTGALFLVWTTNRLVRLVLQIAGTPATKGEATLRGGRMLGPMERLFLGAMIVSGELTAVAVIITAKGLLRLPEIRNAEGTTGQDDLVTEYFLIGTFSSLLVAAVVALLVLAGG